jgi:hypothetical protein
MSSAVWFVLLLAQGIPSDQFPQHDPRATPGVRRVVDRVSVPNPVEVQNRVAACRKRSFEKSFNLLLQKLSDFADAYNRGGAMDVKKVESVKKAWREVEKNEAWFKPDK